MLPEPSPVFGPVPVVAWRHPPVCPPTPVRFRAVAAAMGLCVGLGVDAAGLGVVRAGILGPGALALVSSVLGTPSLGAVVAVTGGAGGWIVAPQAWRAEDRIDWGAVIIELALLAVVIGAVLIGQEGGMLMESNLLPPPVEQLAYHAAAGGFLALMGIALYGIFVLPFTMAASVLWALGLWVLVRRVPARDHAPR